MVSKHHPTITVISGIDTGVGQTVATGLLARWFRDNARSAITMKMVQTGCSGISTDIIEHRTLSGMEMVEEDALGVTCPYVLKVPSSPHLAARLDGIIINPDVLIKSVNELQKKYGHVLLEGAGGLMVPLTEEISVMDFLQDKGWPIVLVTSARAGAINHTLSSLEIINNRKIPLQGIIYNLMGSDTIDGRIVEDSRTMFTRKLEELDLGGRICDIPNVACTTSYCVDFSPLYT